MSTAAFCPHCGAPGSAEAGQTAPIQPIQPIQPVQPGAWSSAPPPQQPPPPGYAPGAGYPAPAQRSSGMPVVLGVLVGVLVFALLGGGVLLYLQGRDDKE